MRHSILSLVNSFKSLLGMNKEMDMYLPVYTAIMNQARKPELYGEQGANDDLVMCLVVFSWMANQRYFK